MSIPYAPATVARTPRWLLWIGGLALALYTWFLAANFSPIAAGADASGYLNSARLLATGHFAMELRSPPEFGPQDALLRQQFQPHGFAPFEGKPGLSPTYAVGLPLHLAAAARLVGWTAAPFVVGLGGAIGALALTYIVGRQFGLASASAATVVVLLAAYPVFLFMAIQPLSDVPATTWCLAAIAAAWRARTAPGWALAAGAALALAVLVRVTNLLLLPALLVLLGANLPRLAWAFLGGLPGAIFLGFYNHALYGSAFRSGYVNISEAFGWSYGLPTLAVFALWLATLFPAVVLVLPWFAQRNAATETRGPVRLALALWFAPFTLLYAFYQISHEVWWDLRFILPATPALLIGAALGLESLWRRKPTPHALRMISLAVLAGWSIALGVYWTKKHHLLLTPMYERKYRDAALAARKEFPADALVIAGQTSGAVYFYTPFPVLRWEFVNAAEFAALRARAETVRRPICAVLFEFEEREALQEHCRGDWAKVAAVGNVSLWQLRGSTP